MQKRILIAHNNIDDPDGNKHDFLMYKYKDYIFRKEWYMNMENEYKLGLTLFKKGKVNIEVPHYEYDGKWYNEIFHSGSFNEEESEEETIELIERIIRK